MTLRLMTRWWFLLILIPFVLGSVGMLLTYGAEVVEAPDVYALWGQFIGAAIPLGITGFAFVWAIKFVSRRRRGDG